MAYVSGLFLTTEAPASLTYSSVVSRDSVKIAFLVGAINDLDIMACNIGNAYLNAPCREKIWFEAGPECGELNGKPCKLVRALYGESGIPRQHLHSLIRDFLSFIPRAEKLWGILESHVFKFYPKPIRI